MRLDRRTRSEETNLPSLEIGPLKRSNLRVVTADLSFYEKVLPVRIDPEPVYVPGRVIRPGRNSVAKVWPPPTDPGLRF